MGNIINRKALLLDERDMDVPPSADLDTLADAVYDFLEDKLQPDGDLDSGCPDLDIFGIASERLDATHLNDGLRFGSGRTDWLDPAEGFRAAWMRKLMFLDLPDPEAVLYEDIGSLRALEPALRRQICEDVMGGNYVKASLSLSNLIQMTSARPFVHSKECLDWSDEEAIFDFREGSYGIGTRIFAEIGYNWGQ